MYLKAKPFSKRCEEEDINYYTAVQYRRRHPDLTDEQVIKYYKAKKSFRDRCEEAGVDYRRVNQLASQYKHLGFTKEQVIHKAAEPKGKSFADKCREHEINCDTARHFKTRHKEMTDDEVIEYYIKDKVFRDKCESNNIEYHGANIFKMKNPDMTDDEIIEYYKIEMETRKK